MMQRLFALALPAELSAARRYRRVLQDVMGRMRLHDDLQDRLLLCLSEAMVNIVDHGRPAATRILLSLFREGDLLTLQLEDDGGAHDDFAQDLANAPTIGEGSLLTHGMGLGLLRQLTDDMHYKARQATVSGDQNRLVVCFDTRARHRPHVAIIDDDPALLMVMEAWLAGQFAVSSYSHAAAALAAFEDVMPDVIISDIQMPDVNGLELRAKMQTHPRMVLTPFIFLTGRQSPVIQAQANSLLVDACLQKPLRKQDLVTVLRRVLARQQDLIQRLQSELDVMDTAALSPRLAAALPGFDHYVSHRPAFPGGGDLVVQARLGDRHFVALIDIMGHDKRAKSLARLCAGFLEGMLGQLDADTDLEAVAGILSEAALTGILKDGFFTACLMTFDVTGQIAFVNMGHVPPVIWRQGLKAESTNTSPGPAPGLLEGWDYQTIGLTLHPGDRFIVYTDGLEEADALGDVPAWLRDQRLSGIEPLATALEQQLTDRSGRYALDDATCLIIEKQEHIR